jgi:hypothetical protein
LRQPSKPFESDTPDYQSGVEILGSPIRFLTLLIKINDLTQKPAYQYFYIRAGAFGINRFGLALNVVGGGLGRMPAKV